MAEVRAASLIQLQVYSAVSRELDRSTSLAAEVGPLADLAAELRALRQAAVGHEPPEEPSETSLQPGPGDPRGSARPAGSAQRRRMRDAPASAGTKNKSKPVLGYKVDMAAVEHAMESEL